jgi:hypothetical protein
MVRRIGITVRARIPGLLLLAIVSLLLLAGCEVDRAESIQENVSSTIGVPVATNFQSFYEEYGGLRVFGSALAEPFTEQDSGRLVQYFQRMRLEYDTALEHVAIFPLGEWAFYVPGNDQAQIASKEELIVKDEFLAFYQASQGASLFGPPISQELDEGGTRVQYFQNARLEWHPDAPLGYRVQVGPLGEAHYRQVGIFDDPGRNRPLDSAAVREAMVSANLRAPILFADEQQALFVDVQTPEGKRPVIGAGVEVALTYNGVTETVRLPDTDGAGHTQGELPLRDVEPGQKVQIIVTASAPGGATIGIATQSFRTWW